MPVMTHGLARRLYNPHMAMHFELASLASNLPSGVGGMEIHHGGGVTLHVGNRSLPDARFDENVLTGVHRHADGLWVVQASAAPAPEVGGVGSASPFDPPTVLELDAELPIQVAESALEALGKTRLKVGEDLARVGSVAIPAQRGPRRREIVLGMRTVGALDETDAERLSIWLPSGKALELRVVREGGRAWLLLVDVVSEGDADTAHAGPNVRLCLGRNAALPLTHAKEARSAPVAVADALRLDPSPVLEAWIRYGAAEHQVLVERQKKREAHPLTFGNARQEGKQWRVDVSFPTPEDRLAWLGANPREGRKLKVDQPVKVLANDDGQDRWTLTKLALQGVSRATGWMKPPGGSARLPPSGQLRATANKGAETAKGRERTALDRLTAGRAASASLISVLREPHTARPPREVRLRTTELALDADQERAVRLIVGCEDMVAIQGPPGTGKTRVIIEALNQIFAQAPSGEPPPRVLVTSVQNEAVANVVERLNEQMAAGKASSSRMVIRLVQRAGRDEDEQRTFADAQERQRDAMLERLDKRLEGIDLTPQLDELSELQRRVAAAGGHLLAERMPAAAGAIAELAQEQTVLLTTLLRESGEDLVAQLEDILMASSMASDASAEESVPSPGMGPLPSEPTEVPAWWACVEGQLDPAVAREVGFHVAGIERLLGRRPSSRRDQRLAEGHRELRDHLQRLAPTLGAPSAAETPKPARLSIEEWRKRASAWIVELEAQLEAQQELLMSTPPAIASRFREALRADAGAWARILDTHANAVAATCSKSAEAALGYGEEFDWVIIDEAGRASPFELLVPLVQGKRVVLIGDHRQLPPMVDRALARAADADQRFDLSTQTLFGEVMQRLPPTCRARLSTQYRMHGDIGDIVDGVFYRPEGEGLTSWFAGPRATERRLTWSTFEHAPLVWIDVPAPRPAATEENLEEVDAVMRVLEEYDCEDRPDRVAVISPYGLQREALERALRKRPHLSRFAEVYTIDQVQGREYPVVVLTLTRTDGLPGFLASPNRINVALSRAQRQLVLVGNGRSFLDSPVVRARAKHVNEVIARFQRHERKV